MNLLRKEELVRVQEKIIQAYFRYYTVSSSKVCGFNWVPSDAQDIVMASSPIANYCRATKTWTVIHLRDLTFSYPLYREHNGDIRTLLPYDCLMRAINYEAPMIATCVHEEWVGENKEFAKNRLDSRRVVPNVVLFYLPVMLRSILDRSLDLSNKECALDDGGYFVVGSKGDSKQGLMGGEKEQMFRERAAYNKIMIWQKKGALLAEIRCEHPKRYRTTSTSFVTLDKCKDNRGFEVKIMMPHMVEKIPFVIVMRALGLCNRSIRIMYQLVCNARFIEKHEMYLEHSIDIHESGLARRDPYAYIGSLVKDGKAPFDRTGLKKVDTELFTHISTGNQSNFQKAWLMCEMVARLFETHYWLERGVDLCCNRDAEVNRRTSCPRELFGILIRQLWNLYHLPTVRTKINKHANKREVFNMHEVMAGDIVSNGISKALGTGNWVAGSSSEVADTKTGVVQVKDRSNFLSMLAQSGKSTTQIHKKGRQVTPRLLLKDSMGYKDPHATPDGPTVGTVVHSTILRSISMGQPPALVTQLLVELGVFSFAGLNPTHAVLTDLFNRLLKSGEKGWVTVYVNGCPIGIYHNWRLLVDYVRHLRRNLMVDPHTSVSVGRVRGPPRGDAVLGEVVNVFVRTDYGRSMRPLIITSDDRALQRLVTCPIDSMTWMDLLAEQMVEYVDPEEEETLFVGSVVVN